LVLWISAFRAALFKKNPEHIPRVGCFSRRSERSLLTGAERPCRHRGFELPNNKTVGKRDKRRFFSFAEAAVAGFLVDGFLDPRQAKERGTAFPMDFFRLPTKYPSRFAWLFSFLCTILIPQKEKTPIPSGVNGLWSK
jgi:hypothetical protein